MIGIPTESLNKFLAIGSLVAMIYMIDVCLKNYEKAELARIAAYVNMMEFKDKYEDFAALTNTSIDIYQKANGVKEKISSDDFKKAQEALKKAHDMRPNMDEMILKSQELVEKAKLLPLLKANMVLVNIYRIWYLLFYSIFRL